MKFSVTERLQQQEKWFNRQNERPLLGFFLDAQYPLHRYYGAKNLPQGQIEPKDIIVEDYLSDYDRLHELSEEAGGDFLWFACPFWGMPWVEAALGCDVFADHQTGSTRAVSPAGFAENPVIPEFSAENPWVAKMLEFIPAIEKHAAGRYGVGVTLMRGISDLLSALYGGEKFILRMYDDPNEVKAVVEKLTDFWIAFGKCLLSHVPRFHGGTGAFFYGVWCPGETIWTQEDAAALLSPDMYEKFIFPNCCRIADAFEHMVIHLHPSMFIPVEYLVKSPIDVIELHIDKGGPTAEQLYEKHMTVLAQKPLLVWGDITEDDLEFMLKNLPARGLAINMVASSVEQTREIWDKYSKIIKKGN